MGNHLFWEFAYLPNWNQVLQLKRMSVVLVFPSCTPWRYQSCFMIYVGVCEPQYAYLLCALIPETFHILALLSHFTLFLVGTLFCVCIMQNVWLVDDTCSTHWHVVWMLAGERFCVCVCVCGCVGGWVNIQTDRKRPAVFVIFIWRGGVWFPILVDPWLLVQDYVDARKNYVLSKSKSF